MLLGYIHSDLSFSLSLKHSSCTCQEKLSRHAEELNMAKNTSLKNFYQFVHTVDMLFFTLKIIFKKPSISGGYCNVSRQSMYQKDKYQHPEIQYFIYQTYFSLQHSQCEPLTYRVGLFIEIELLFISTVWILQQ